MMVKDVTLSFTNAIWGVRGMLECVCVCVCVLDFIEGFEFVKQGNSKVRCSRGGDV